MGIVAKSGAAYPLAPAGTHAAVCVDVIDLGILKVAFGGKEKQQHKIAIVWQIDEVRDDGKPHTIRKRYTLSLHQKASLRKDLESWRGKAFTEVELQGFDLECLLSVSCLLSVIHASSDGSTFANIASIMKLPKAMEPVKVRDYVRVCDREPDDQGSGGPPPPQGGYDPSDDEVPF